MAAAVARGGWSAACPGLCRSGAHSESIAGVAARQAGVCRTHVDQRGHCIKAVSGPMANGVDCRGCRSLGEAAWDEDALPSVERSPQFGGAFVSVRLRSARTGPGASADGAAPPGVHGSLKLPLVVLPAWAFVVTLLGSWGAGVLGLFALSGGRAAPAPAKDLQEPKLALRDRPRLDLLRRQDSSIILQKEAKWSSDSIVVQKEAKLQILP